MMGMDNITCPSKAPVAGCAVGVPASVRTRGFGPQLAAARCELRSGIQIAWVARQRRWHGGMWVIDCPGERRVRENRMHGVGGGGRKRTDDAQPRADRWVAYRQRASRLPHLAEISAGVPDAPSVWFAGWCGTAMLVRVSLAVEKSAEVVLPAGSMFAGKGRTRSRALGRSCSWSLH
jgi:hypothetical protein